MPATARHGGVIAIAGDDHDAKSSTAAHQKRSHLQACGPAGVLSVERQDILDMGLHAFA